MKSVKEKEEPGGSKTPHRNQKIQRFSVSFLADTFLGTFLQVSLGLSGDFLSFGKHLSSKLRYLPAYYLSNHLLGLNYAAENQFLSMEKAIETKK